MAKPYDVTTKDRLRRDPASWMAYLGVGAVGPIEVIDDLEKLERLTDRILNATSWDDLLSPSKP